MTENEAIKEIKRWTSILMYAGSQCVMETAEAQEMAIQALEEIQQYRAIGLTPKMVKEMIESEKLASHQAIIRGAKLEQYQAIGTIDEFKALKEKSVAKKPRVYANGTRHCPNEDCEEVIYTSDEYCLKCGTKIDWSE